METLKKLLNAFKNEVVCKIVTEQVIDFGVSGSDLIIAFFESTKRIFQNKKTKKAFQNFYLELGKQEGLLEAIEIVIKNSAPILSAAAQLSRELNEVCAQEEENLEGILYYIGEGVVDRFAKRNDQIEDLLDTDEEEEEDALS